MALLAPPVVRGQSFAPQPGAQVLHAAGMPGYSTAPYAGRVNHAHHSPTYRWGWFGAEHFYPSVKWHRGYNGDHFRWSRQRRY